MSLTTRLAAVAAPPIDTRLEALTQQLHDLRATIDTILETLTRQQAAADALEAPAAVVAQMTTEMLTPMPAPATQVSEIEALESEVPGYEVEEYATEEMSETADAVVEAVAEDHPAEDVVADSVIAPAAEAGTENYEPTSAIEPESTVSDADEVPATPIDATEMQPAPAVQAETEPGATEVVTTVEAATMQEETNVDLAAPSEGSESAAEPSASTPEAITADLDTTEPMADLPAPAMTAPTPEAAAPTATVISLSDHRRDEKPQAESIVRVVRPRRRAAKIAACILAAMAAGSLWFADLSALGGVPSSLGRALSAPPAAADWSFGELWQRIQAGARAAEVGRHSGAMGTEGFAGLER